MTRAGAMRHVVRIEQRLTNQDAAGEPSPSWSLVTQRRAEMLPTPGTEVWSGNERNGRVPTVFKLRWPREVTVLAQMRLTTKGRVYNILSAVNDGGRGVDLLLSCEELVGEPTS